MNGRFGKKFWHRAYLGTQKLDDVYAAKCRKKSCWYTLGRYIGEIHWGDALGKYTGEVLLGIGKWFGNFFVLQRLSMQLMGGGRTETLNAGSPIEKYAMFCSVCLAGCLVVLLDTFYLMSSLASQVFHVDTIP